MSKFDAYATTFERGASPFVRWSLSPFLLLFGVIFSFQSVECVQDGRLTGTIACLALVLACLCGLLALWGVRHIGRVVTGVVALSFGYYLIDECFVSFDGLWGIGAPRSETTPINAVVGFIIFGLPCLIYTILGRFTLRAPEPEFDDALFFVDEFAEQEETDKQDVGGMRGDS